MFIIMVLIVHAAGEWVEISQQHYRKPVHNNYNFHDITEIYFDETTTKTNRIYNNHSITEYAWQKGNVDKVPKLGSVQRVQLDANVVKAPNIRENLKYNKMGNDAKNYNKQYHDVRQTSASSVKETEGDRIELNNFFQASHEENSFHTDITSANKVTDSGSQNTDTGIPKYQRKPTINVPKINKPLDRYSDFVTEKDKEDIFNIKPFNEYVSTEAASTSAIEIFTNSKPKRGQHNDNRYTNLGSYINWKNPSAIRDYVDNQENGQFVKRVHSAEPSEDSGNNRYTDSQLPENNRYTDSQLPEDNRYTDAQLPENNGYTGSQLPENPYNNYEEQIPTEKEEDANDASGDKVNTIETLLQFMKMVSDTIRRNTRRSVSSKTRYLQNLKDTILANIEERIESTWPDDEGVPTRPRREARGHLEVPSSESALMTISFLTFAVFLIKLVLQVIQTYKNKAMMVTPAVVATVGRVAAAARTTRNGRN